MFVFVVPSVLGASLTRLSCASGALVPSRSVKSGAGFTSVHLAYRGWKAFPQFRPEGRYFSFLVGGLYDLVRGWQVHPCTLQSHPLWNVTTEVEDSLPSPEHTGCWPCLYCRPLRFVLPCRKPPRGSILDYNSSNEINISVSYWIFRRQWNIFLARKLTLGALGLRFCKVCSKLRAAAATARKKLWKVLPKVHLCLNFCEWQSVSFAYPRFVCSSDEDMVGQAMDVAESWHSSAMATTELFKCRAFVYAEQDWNQVHTKETRVCNPQKNMPHLQIHRKTFYIFVSNMSFINWYSINNNRDPHLEVHVKNWKWRSPTWWWLNMCCQKTTISTRIFCENGEFRSAAKGTHREHSQPNKHLSTCCARGVARLIDVGGTTLRLHAKRPHWWLQMHKNGCRDIRKHCIIIVVVIIFMSPMSLFSANNARAPQTSIQVNMGRWLTRGSQSFIHNKLGFWSTFPTYVRRAFF